MDNFLCILLLWAVALYILLIPIVRSVTKYRFSSYEAPVTPTVGGQYSFNQVDNFDLAQRRKQVVLRAYSDLAVAFLLLIATQWLAQPVRSSAFQRHVSPAEESHAKEISTLVMIPTVLTYSVLASLLQNQKKLIFYVCVFYGVVFVLFATYLVYLDLHEDGQALLHDHTHSNSLQKELHGSSNSLRSIHGAESVQSHHFFLFSGNWKRFWMYVLYAVIDTKAGLALSMVWSCAHLLFKEQQTNATTGTSSSFCSTFMKASIVYPYLNFWCQIGGTLGALGGVLTKTLQIPIAGTEKIITGSSVLYFFLGFGTLLVPYFAIPAFKALERVQREESGLTRLSSSSSDFGQPDDFREDKDQQRGFGAGGASSLSPMDPKKVYPSGRAPKIEYSSPYNTGEQNSEQDLHLRANRTKESNYAMNSSPKEQELHHYGSGSAPSSGIAGDPGEDQGEHEGLLSGYNTRGSPYQYQNSSARTINQNRIDLEAGMVSSSTSLNNQHQTSQSRSRPHSPDTLLPPATISPADGSSSLNAASSPKRTFRQACYETWKQSTEGLHVLLTNRYVFLIWICSSGHLAIRTLLELQGSVLVSYVHQYPADDGLSLKGPNPKKVGDNRTKLISAMLLLNGVLSAAVSFCGTSALVKEYGIAKILRVNPICCFAMLGVFCSFAMLSERQGFVTVNETLRLTRPQVEWNDNVVLTRFHDHTRHEDSQNDHWHDDEEDEASQHDAFQEARALAVDPPASQVHELTADGIIHLQGCGSSSVSDLQRLIQLAAQKAQREDAERRWGGRPTGDSTSSTKEIMNSRYLHRNKRFLAAFSWRDPATNDLTNFFQLKQCHSADYVESELAKREIMDPRGGGLVAAAKLSSSSPLLAEELGEEELSALDQEQQRLQAAPVTQDLSSCRKLCADRFPLCNHVSLNRETRLCRFFHVNDDEEETITSSAIGQYHQASPASTTPAFGDTDSATATAALLRSHQRCQAVKNRHMETTGQSSVNDEKHQFYEMRPKCGFRDMVRDAELGGAAGVILVNPGTRRRVEKIATGAGTSRTNSAVLDGQSPETGSEIDAPSILTLFVSEGEYEQHFKQHEVLSSGTTSGSGSSVGLSRGLASTSSGTGSNMLQPNTGPRADLLTTDYQQLQSYNSPGSYHGSGSGAFNTPKSARAYRDRGTGPMTAFMEIGHEEQQGNHNYLHRWSASSENGGETDLASAARDFQEAPPRIVANLAESQAPPSSFMSLMTALQTTTGLDFSKTTGSLEQDHELNEISDPPRIRITRTPGRHYLTNALSTHFGLNSSPWLSYYALFVICSLCSIVMNVFVFAINNPMVEVLYLQTSKVAKVKAKSWISAFGSNLIRALGNRVNTVCNSPIFDPFSSVFFSSIWFLGWFAACTECGHLHNHQQVLGGSAGIGTKMTG
ncbi:unnamed protein product, partial [Amoebophrya sp. A120]|eukprot:GSA120T00007837001.1